MQRRVIQTDFISEYSYKDCIFIFMMAYEHVCKMMESSLNPLK